MDTIGIGLIGTGFMGKSHAMAYRAMPSIFSSPPAVPILEMLADATSELARSAAEIHGFARWTADWRELVTDPAVDIVDIAGPGRPHSSTSNARSAARFPGSTARARRRSGTASSRRPAPARARPRP